MTQPEVLQIATAHGVGPAQIGLKWIVQQGLPLTTAVWDLKYMRQDLDLWSWVCTSFFEFSLCLSRACLGKTIHFIYKWRKKWRFPHRFHVSARLCLEDGGVKVRDCRRCVF
jgi:hypothetical protein